MDPTEFDPVAFADQAPYDVETRLTEIAQAVMPMGMIADTVCPPIQTGSRFTYYNYDNADLLTIPDVRASRAGELNEIEFGADSVTDNVIDYGLQDPVPHRDLAEAMAQNVPLRPLEHATVALAGLVMLAREKRTADLIFNTDSYLAGQRATLSGSSQWSHNASEPIAAITRGLDECLVRPNLLVFGQQAWTDFRQHPAIVEAVQMSGAGAGASGARGMAMRGAVAELFEVDQVVVGQTWHQSAVRGRDEVYSRLWGKHCAAIHINPALTGTDQKIPTFAFTASFLRQEMRTYEAPGRGISAGSTVVKCSESCKELVSFKRAGYFWQNAVA